MKTTSRYESPDCRSVMVGELGRCCTVLLQSIWVKPS